MRFKSELLGSMTRISQMWANMTVIYIKYRMFMYDLTVCIRYFLLFMGNIPKIVVKII